MPGVVDTLPLLEPLSMYIILKEPDQAKLSSLASQKNLKFPGKGPEKGFIWELWVTDNASPKPNPIIFQLGYDPNETPGRRPFRPDDREALVVMCLATKGDKDECNAASLVNYVQQTVDKTAELLEANNPNRWPLTDTTREWVVTSVIDTSKSGWLPGSQVPDHKELIKKCEEKGNAARAAKTG